MENITLVVKKVLTFQKDPGWQRRCINMDFLFK